MSCETKTNIHKRAMIEALKKSMGIVTHAAEIAGVSRIQHYHWMKEDPEYAAEVESLKDMVIDFAESKLHKRINQGSDTAIIFFLKTQGKRRGYIERTEVENIGPIQLLINEDESNL